MSCKYDLKIDADFFLLKLCFTVVAAWLFASLGAESACLELRPEEDARRRKTGRGLIYSILGSAYMLNVLYIGDLESGRRLRISNKERSIGCCTLIFKFWGHRTMVRDWGQTILTTG